MKEYTRSVASSAARSIAMAHIASAQDALFLRFSGSIVFSPGAPGTLTESGSRHRMESASLRAVMDLSNSSLVDGLVDVTSPSRSHDDRRRVESGASGRRCCAEPTTGRPASPARTEHPVAVAES